VPKCEMTTEDGWNECHQCEALWPVGKPWTGWRPSMCVEPKEGEKRDARKNAGGREPPHGGGRS
jgi:hypothetical protein